MTRRNQSKITRRQALQDAAKVVAAVGVSDLLTTAAQASEALDAPSGNADARTISGAGRKTPLPDHVSVTSIPHRLTPVPIHQVIIEDDFWTPKFKIWRDVTIGDCFTKYENDRGGAINNFDLIRDGKIGRHAGPPGTTD